MKRLILMRHAEAERASPGGGDFDRRLTARGREDAATVGRALAGAGLVPHIALVSPARRAQETWDAAHPSLPDAHLELAPDLYNAPAETLLNAAKDTEGAGTVMIVAHNPGVHELALKLAEAATLIDPAVRSRLDTGFPTTSAIAFEFIGDRTACLGLFSASDLGEGDGA